MQLHVVCNRIREIDKEVGELGVGKVFSALNLAGCLTTKQVAIC